MPILFAGVSLDFLFYLLYTIIITISTRYEVLWREE